MTDSAFAPIPIRPPSKYRRADKLPESIARRFAHNDRFVLVEPPFAETSFAWALYWDRRHSGDGGHAWLREQIATVAQELKPNQITLQLKTGQTRKPMQ